MHARGLCINNSTYFIQALFNHNNHQYPTCTAGYVIVKLLLTISLRTQGFWKLYYANYFSSVNVNSFVIKILMVIFGKEENFSYSLHFD